MVGGDAEVAHLRDQETAGEGDAVDRGDGRLGDQNIVADHRHQPARRDAQRRGAHFLEVHAGAEGLLAGAGQDGDAGVLVLLEPVPGVPQALADGNAERVAAIGLVDRDDRDVALHLIQNCVRHSLRHSQKSLAEFTMVDIYVHFGERKSTGRHAC
jgi:hypothetical protein